jgi:hypothetical protein
MQTTLSGISIQSVGAYADVLKSPRGRLRSKQLKTKARQLEEVIAVGRFLFLQVRKIEANWLSAIALGKADFDPSDDALILAMHRHWLEPTQEVIRQIESCEKQGKKVKSTMQFIKYIDRMNKLVIQWPNHRNPRLVRIADDGRVFGIDGTLLSCPGLEPEKVKQGIADDVAGRVRSLREIIRDREANALRSESH